MPLLPVFIESRFHELNTLAIALQAKLRSRDVAFEWHTEEANRANDPLMYATHIVRHLSDTHNAATNFKNARNYLPVYKKASLWSRDGWKDRIEFNKLVDESVDENKLANGYADSLKKNINAKIKAQEKCNDDFGVEKSNLEYLRARYFASWWKKWLLSLLTAGFFILFLLGLSALTNIYLLGFTSILLVKGLITLNALFASSFFVLQGIPATIAFTVIFGILALLTFRELVDPGFYIKCFGCKRAIEFHYGADWIEFKAECEEEYCAKEYQYDDEFTAAVKILLNPRLLSELILKGIEFLLCRFVDFVDSFFMKSNREQSTVGARAIKWFIHIIFCLLSTPLQLLRPIEDFPYWALKTIYWGLEKIFGLISACFSKKYPEGRRRVQGPWSLQRYLGLAEQETKAFAAKIDLEYASNKPEDKQPVARSNKHERSKLLSCCLFR